jgi:hypothetical protein
MVQLVSLVRFVTYLENHANDNGKHMAIVSKELAFGT